MLTDSRKDESYRAVQDGKGKAAEGISNGKVPALEMLFWMVSFRFLAI